MWRYTTVVGLLWLSVYCPQSFCSEQKQTPNEPRMLLNPGSSATWDQYNNDNDFMLERNPIISAIISSALTPTSTTSTSTSSSTSSKTESVSSSTTTPITKILEKLEKDLIEIIDEEQENLESFILTKVEEFGSKLTNEFDGNSSLIIRKIAEMQNQVDYLQNEIKVQQNLKTNQILENRIDDLDYDPDQAKAALDLADYMDKLIREYDIYNTWTPTLNKIQAFRNSRKETRMENRMQRRSSDSGCGGVLVSDLGEIFYNPDDDLDQLTSLTSPNCVWTLRVTQREQISFKLEEDNFPRSSETYLAIHSLTTVPTSIFGMISITGAGNVGIKGPIILRAGDKSEVIVDGPIVFIILITNPRLTQPQFKLVYKSIGPKILIDSKTPTKYNHFHYTDLEGSVDYPIQPPKNKLRKGRVGYKGPEIATFTILPQITDFEFFNRTEFSTSIFIEEIGIRESLFWAGCDQDSLTFFGIDQKKQMKFRNQKKYLPIVGKKAANQKMDRYCGYSDEFAGDLVYNEGPEPIIVVFKTDLILGGRGFQFSWESE